MVGYLVPDNGFVPVGGAAANLPRTEVSLAPWQSSSPRAGQLALCLRNDRAVTQWSAISGPTGLSAGNGFWANSIGAACDPFEPGDGIPLVDRNPAEAGAQVTSRIHVRPNRGDPPIVWIKIDPAGFVTNGAGVPDWWSGGRLDC